MKKDRFLIVILIAIVILIGSTTILLFTQQGKKSYSDGDTPENVVNNYALSLFNHDYRKAYSYLADKEYKPTYNEFSESFMNTYSTNVDEMALNVGEAEITGDNASVTIYILSKGQSLSISRSNNSAQLIYQDGDWKMIDAGSYNLWNYNWYQEPYEYE